MAMTHCKECGEEISKSAKTCPKCGKKQKNSTLRIILGIIIVIIAIGVIAGSGNNSTNNSTGNTTTVATEKFTLVSSEMTSDSYGTYVEGTIKNNTDKSYSYVQVTFNLFDSEGNQLGTAIDNINNFQPNSTWKYKAVGLTTEKAARCEFVEITGW